MAKRFGLRSAGLALGLSAVLLLVFRVPTFALDCDSSNQQDMNQCAGNDFQKADNLLNERYKKIVACLKGNAQPLVEAQRAWIKFRDAECKFQVGPREDGGSSWPMVMNSCLQSVTEERNNGLNYYLTCEEGDLSCPTVGCGFKKAGAPK